MIYHPDVEDALAKYCIQDTELTHAIFKKWELELPCSEYDLIDITTRMFTKPRLIIDRERLTNYMERERLNAETTIEASGVEPEVLRSNARSSQTTSTPSLSS